MRAKLKVLENKHGNQCCPNLSFEGIGTGADKRLDLEMLLEHLEEEFDLPAVSIDIASGGSSKAKVVGEKLDLPLVFVIPDHYPAQQPRVFQPGIGSGEANNLVGKDIRSFWQGAALYDFINRVAFHPGNEENASAIPLSEKVGIIVAAIDSDDAAIGKPEMAGDGDVSGFAISDDGEVREIPIMVQKEMELNGAFGLAEFSPGKEAETKVDSGGIKAEQLILETEFLFLSRALAAKQVTQMKEDILIKLPGAVRLWRIGVGKRTPGRSSVQSQMTELATGNGKAVTDLPQALALGQLAKQHGDILVPGGKSLGMALCTAFMNQPHKREPRYVWRT